MTMIVDILAGSRRGYDLDALEKIGTAIAEAYPDWFRDAPADIEYASRGMVFRKHWEEET